MSDATLDSSRCAVDGGGASGVGSTNFAALHRLPLGSAAAEVVPGGSDQVVVLLQDVMQGEAGHEGRLLWLTRPELLQRMRSGLHTLDAAARAGPPQPSADSTASVTCLLGVSE